MRYAAIFCGLLAYGTEGDAIRWIEREGGRVEKDSAGRVVAADLTSTFITGAALDRLQEFPHLRRLTLAHSRITDSGFDRIGKLRGIAELDCYYAEHITDDALAHLRGWTSLERLILRGTRVTSKVFEHIARFQNLRHLDLGFSQIDDAGIEQLAGLPHLEFLSIGGNRVGNNGLSQLRLLPSLRRLDLSGIQRVDSGLWGIVLTEAAFGEIAALRELRYLDLNGATLTDFGADRPGLKEAKRRRMEGIDKLSALTKLEFLNVSRLPLAPGDLAALRKLPALKTLRAEMIETAAVQ